MLLIAEADSQPVGVLRYDVADRRATVSIYMRSGQAGKGLGTRILRAGSAWLAAHRPDIQNIDAVVRPENMASRRAFIKAGFLEQDAGFTFDINRESTP
jgi:RimJ/RimL family protein N-acetyltransferase